MQNIVNGAICLFFIFFIFLFLFYSFIHPFIDIQNTFEKFAILKF